MLPEPVHPKPAALPPDDIASKEQARAAGWTRYWSYPCAQGHNGLRYVSNGTCYECLRNSKMRRAKQARQDQTAIKRGPRSATEEMRQQGLGAFLASMTEGKHPCDAIGMAYGAMRDVLRSSVKQRIRLRQQHLTDALPAKLPLDMLERVEVAVKMPRDMDAIQMGRAIERHKAEKAALAEAKRARREYDKSRKAMLEGRVP